MKVEGKYQVNCLFQIKLGKGGIEVSGNDAHDTGLYLLKLGSDNLQPLFGWWCFGIDKDNGRRFNGRD